MIIIKAHEVGAWQRLIEEYEVTVPSVIVRNEARYFRSVHKQRYKINLDEVIKNEGISEMTATLEEYADVQKMFANWFLETLDPGETEALALLKAGRIPKTYFCTSDGPAIKALAMIDMADWGISMETMLAKIGLRKNMDWWFAESYFRERIGEGQKNRITGYGLAPT